MRMAYVANPAIQSSQCGTAERLASSYGTERISQFFFFFLGGGVKFSLNTLRTGDVDLRFYVTTVQDG